MQELTSNFLRQENFAVVGSFRSEDKYAYRIFRGLLKKGYNVFPVNPYMKEVDGNICYKNIEEIPFRVDVITLLTPPKVTEVIVKGALKKGVNKVWMQPGAESEEAIKFCGDNGISVISGSCLILSLLKERDYYAQKG